MSFRTTIVLFAVVVALVAVLLVNTLINDDKPAPMGIVDPLTRVGQKPTDVDTIEMIRTDPNEQKLVFIKQADGWVLSEPYAAKVDGTKLDAVIRALFTAKPVTYTLGNLTVHGLDKPSMRVTLRGKNGIAATVNLGNTTIGDAKAVTFITTGERADTPIAVSHPDVSALFRPEATSHDGPAAKTARWLSDYRQRRLLAVDVSNLSTGVRSIKLTRGPATLALSADKNGDWVFDTPPGLGAADTLGDSAAKADTFTGVRPILNALSLLQVAGNQDYLENQNAAQVAQYGLAANDPNVIRVELQPQTGAGMDPGAKTTGAAEVLYLGKPVEANGKPVAPAQIYCRLEGDAAVMKVTTELLAPLTKVIADPSALRNRDLIPQLSKDRIDAIDSVVNGQPIKLRRFGEGTDPQWVVYGGSEAYIANRVPVRALIEALSFPRAARDVLTGPNEEPFAKPVAELKVWLGGQAKPTPLTDGKLPPEPAITGNPISFTVGKTDGDVTYLRRTADGASTVFRLLNDRVTPLTRGRLDYIDAKIPSFNVTLANRLAFNRGAEQNVMTKAVDPDPYYPNGKWTYSSPEAMKDRTADPYKISNLLTLLSTSQGAKLIAESPTPEQLKAWGLDPAAPRMRITVGLEKDKEKELVYELGNETEDKQSVYMKLGGKPFVVLVSKVVFSEFTGNDLRDPILFRADSAKVVQVDLLGWKGAAPAPTAVKVRREKTGWAALEPPGFDVDGAKMDALVKLLEAPRAAEFLATLPPHEQHGVNVADGGLEIVLHLADGKPGRLLRLGKEDAAKKGVFALSSSLKGGEMVMLPSAAFLQYVANSKSISK